MRAVLGDEWRRNEVAAMADEVLAETGNVILTGCLSTLANMLQRLARYVLARSAARQWGAAFRA